MLGVVEATAKPRLGTGYPFPHDICAMGAAPNSLSAAKIDLRQVLSDAEFVGFSGLQYQYTNETDTEAWVPPDMTADDKCLYTAVDLGTAGANEESCTGRYPEYNAVCGAVTLGGGASNCTDAGESCFAVHAALCANKTAELHAANVAAGSPAGANLAFYCPNVRAPCHFHTSSRSSLGLRRWPVDLTDRICER